MADYYIGYNNTYIIIKFVHWIDKIVSDNLTTEYQTLLVSVLFVRMKFVECLRQDFPKADLR